MASHAPLLVSENYATLLPDRIGGRMEDQARQFDPAITSPTSVLTGTVRFNSSTSRWEKWTGTAWLELASSFAINTTGTSGNVTGVVALVNGGTGGTTKVSALSGIGAMPVTMDFTGFGIVPEGAVRLTNPGSTSRTLQTVIGGNWASTAIDVPGGLTAPNVLSRTTTSAQNIVGPITGSFDSATTICNRLPAATNINFDFISGAGYSTFASGNGNNANEPAGAVGLYGDYVLYDGQFPRQEIRLQTASGGRIFYRSKYALFPWSGIAWQEQITSGNRAVLKGATDDNTTDLQAGTAKFVNLSATNQPSAYLSNSAYSTFSSGSNAYKSYTNSGSTSAGLTVSPSFGSIFVNESAWYNVEQDYAITITGTQVLSHVNFSLSYGGGGEIFTTHSIVRPDESFQICGVRRRLYLTAGTSVQAVFGGAWISSGGIFFGHKCDSFKIRRDIDQSF